METTKFEIYNHYIALVNFAVASMSGGINTLKREEFPPDIKMLKQYLKKHKGRKY